ncbi:MAG: hypothetical protein JSU82_00560 [Rhodospirillales bacterium]|nr:MAG: hypothetical protein JSU82_00560 [Rhodospirillales bacterium]
MTGTRPEQLGDAALIHRVNNRAFGQAGDRCMALAPGARVVCDAAVRDAPRFGIAHD